MPDNLPGKAGNILTRKIGGVPVWTWAAGATGLALLGFVWLRRTQTANAATNAQTDATNAQAQGLTQSTQGASAIPIVVSPANTGLPPTPVAPTTATQGALSQGSQALVSNGDGQSVLIVRPGSDPNGSWQQAGRIPDQAIVTISGPPVTGMWGTGASAVPFTAVPINFAGQQVWVNAISLHATGTGGGSGGNRSSGRSGRSTIHGVRRSSHPVGHGGGGISGMNAALAGQRTGYSPVGVHWAAVSSEFASTKLGVPLARLQSLNGVGGGGQGGSARTHRNHQSNDRFVKVG